MNLWRLHSKNKSLSWLKAPNHPTPCVIHFRTGLCLPRQYVNRVTPHKTTAGCILTRALGELNLYLCPKWQPTHTQHPNNTPPPSPLTAHLPSLLLAYLHCKTRCLLFWTHHHQTLHIRLRDCSANWADNFGPILGSNRSAPPTNYPPPHPLYPLLLLRCRMCCALNSVYPARDLFAAAGLHNPNSRRYPQIPWLANRVPLALP